MSGDVSGDVSDAPRPRRVLIAGVTGAGKTTFARRLAREWGLRHVELDALYHGPQWQPRPEFLVDVRAFAAEERWVTEWQYTSLTDEVLVPRAELVVWLDHPFWLVRVRLLRRTLRRLLLGEELWNGNRESWRNLLRRDERSLLHWQILTRHKWAERMPGVRARFPHLQIVRLRTPRESRQWWKDHGRPAG